jgi:oligoribonuclease
MIKAITIYERGDMSNSVWVWLDLEMTGLDIKTDQILEVSCILTTPALHEFTSKSFSYVVHYDDNVLESMSEWCVTHHAESGLTQAVRESVHSLDSVEKDLIKYIQDHTLPTDMLYLSGNSIHTDRTFVKQYMKRLESVLHYRMVDVTAIAMFCETLGIDRFKKETTHRALDDILGSIAELRYYKAQLKDHKFDY